ncbi:hypothetical protein [Methylobacterium dankookense]|uniref:Uncharacterized protein n=1 Tax=Methylobacterium dankookense TaxID=560405 RepID=A0A564G6B2_9HYPH|nr:hypothetical protein [Methylobacterium dankookense]GJD59729.1 hypothetical protein IFDJLNFL_5660 [Methylobacterium dankookense]VUF15877.1 hypothetical protein MTDSW087_05625 [Methylobacterium dankookense]
MAGSAEDRLDKLNAQILVLEAQRNDQIMLIEAQEDKGQDAGIDTVLLRQIEERIAGLKVRTATFEGDPRHV